MTHDGTRLTIVFETHATSLDNERGLASGWFDVDLSPLGIQQARELGERYASDRFEAIFCPDLRRAYRTAVITFADRNVPIIRDCRLRECDYGQWTRRPLTEVERAKPAHITTPFPGGESYQQAVARVGEFLVELATRYCGTRSLIIGCRATHYGLEHWFNRTTLTQAVAAPFTWQPGWIYSLKPTTLAGLARD
jgi:2,3-bisphosphoglycerate-dependent phosphoglycerate mutase